mmetsp:Transcript_38628/g.120699  ORF Transcript_38628/g.120699 Transcript_38628/m.120699 type:complete len:242 (+) Transcript_38628:126-851(+)
MATCTSQPRRILLPLSGRMPCCARSCGHFYWPRSATGCSPLLRTWRRRPLRRSCTRVALGTVRSRKALGSLFLGTSSQRPPRVRRRLPPARCLVTITPALAAGRRAATPRTISRRRCRAATATPRQTVAIRASAHRAQALSSRRASRPWLPHRSREACCWRAWSGTRGPLVPRWPRRPRQAGRGQVHHAPERKAPEPHWSPGPLSWCATARRRSGAAARSSWRTGQRPATRSAWEPARSSG